MKAGEGVERETFCVTVKFELKALQKIFLQQDSPEHFARLGGGVCVNRQIVFVGLDPVWSPDDLGGMQPIHERDEIA